MATSWNYERRHLTCGKFVVGVWLIAKGKAGFDTSIEAVRNRVRLPPEDALFAARRLDEEGLLAFEPGGTVTSNGKGIARAEELIEAGRAKALDFDDAKQTLARGGLPLEMLKLAAMACGGSLPCGADAAHRLALAGDELALERRTPDGGYEPEPPAAE
jgi:hypothetical protein